MPDYAARRDRLRQRLKRVSADALLVTNFTNVTYLTGFTGDDSYLVVRRDGDVLLSDFRYEEQLAAECPGLEALIRRAPTTQLDLVAKVMGRGKISRLAIEADSMTVSQYGQLTDKLPDLAVLKAQGWVQELRAIKDKDEIEAIRRAVDLAQRAFAVVKASLRPEQTEREVAFALEQQIRLFGGEGCSFKPIVAGGPRAALPHARSGEQAVGQHGLLLCDWGAIAGGYMSDLTRIITTAKIPPKLERVYGVVLTAQLKAIAAIRPGALMSQVDAAARAVIEAAGFGKRFGHGLGHGIGLEIHEQPRLAPKQERPLQAGMVVTVEPGIYLPGWGGVRIEDDVLVTRTGHDVLSSAGKELADCAVHWPGQ